MKKGFALIEVLVTSIIVGFVLTGVAMFLILTARISDRSIVVSRAQSNLNLVYRDIANEVRNSKIVSASKFNKDTLYITKTDNSHVFFVFDRAHNKLLKKVGDSPFKEVSIISTGSQINQFDCAFSNPATNANQVIVIEKLTYCVKNNGKTKIIGLTGHVDGTSIAVRND